MIKKLALALLLSAALAGGAHAATQDITVSANVVGTCRFDSAANVGFGLLDQTSVADATATGSLVFWCTQNTNYTLSDEANVGTADGVFTGSLVDGGNSIPYELTYTNVSGPGAGKNSPITSVITGTIANADFVDAPAGTYSDTVTFTITP